MDLQSLGYVLQIIQNIGKSGQVIKFWSKISESTAQWTQKNMLTVYENRKPFL